MYPWPSFGAFQFLREETAHFNTDAGWNLSPSYVTQRPLGSGTSVSVTTAIGSADRSFELTLAPARLALLQTFLNTVALFTDWSRPLPDSRLAKLTEVSSVDYGAGGPGFNLQRIRTKISLLSQ